MLSSAHSAKVWILADLTVIDTSPLRRVRDQLALPFNSALMRSGVNGTVRSRTPVASYTALPSAAPTAAHAASPAPSGGSFGRSTRSMSSLGTSENLRIG